MSNERHAMSPTARNDTETLFECTVDGCGHRVVLNRVEQGRLTVISQGNWDALHYGSSGPVAIAAEVMGRPHSIQE